MTKQIARIWFIINAVLLLGAYWTYYLFPTKALTTAIAAGLSYGIYGLAALLWFSVTIIGRQSGLTNGIGGSILIMGILWQLIVSGTLYQLKVIYFIVMYMPMVLQLIGTVWLAADLFVSRNKTGKIDWSFKPIFYELVITVLAPFTLFMLAQVPRTVAAYVQYGVEFNPWTSYNLYFTSVPLIVMLVLVIGQFAMSFVQKLSTGQIVGAGLAVLGLVVYAVIYFAFQTYFIFEIAPFALTLFMVGVDSLLPLNKIRD